MLLKSIYLSPLGEIVIVSDEKYLKGIWFKDQKSFGGYYDIDNVLDGENEIILEAKKWLKRYFAGENPLVNKDILMPDATDFRRTVLEILLTIPYGQTTTYKEIACKISGKNIIKTNLSRAVGGAIGKNPISIMIPCHRVIGTNGNLTGYSGGIDKKEFLLDLEKKGSK